ncbi:MAG TPA: family 16 glycoside hydrolase [Candidatus Acidoferrum sp.]|nr:family 16 glycoside hydrolase [Candidatus Acidoferrum sp.]
MRNHVLWPVLLFALAATAAERKFDFSETAGDQTPPGFRSVVTGKGKPGEWRVVLDDVPSQMPAITPMAAAVAKRPVLAQLSQDPTDERFPLLIYQEETYDDFTLTTRLKMVKGVMEQMAGIAFRIQNETNYYVVRASALGNTFRFYKVVNGQRGTLIGPEVPISAGVWHDLVIDCKGNQIRCLFDGKELIPMLTDNSFVRGKIGFWTKSDSVSYFADTRIAYKPHEPPAQAIVREALKNYPRLLGLEVFVLAPDPHTPRLIGSKDPKEIGKTGGHVEQDVIERSVTYYGKGKASVVVTMPLHDRNGDTVAAARVIMRTFPGETEQNAVTRALPIVKDMEQGVTSLQALLE